MKFIAVASPSEHQIEAVAGVEPVNPFFTSAYVQARLSAENGVPYIFGVDGEDALINGCPAFVYEHRWTRTLEIESLPRLGEKSKVFWDGLLAFCRSHRITILVLGSFASQKAEIPAIRQCLLRRRRTEHILDLKTDQASRKLSSQHRRNLKKAQKADLTVVSTTSDDAMRIHVQLMTSSLERRADRGEMVHIDEEMWRRNVAFLRSGAGEIFQAVQDGEVVSSILILLSETGAYYQSAGTSSVERSNGASPFLIEQASRMLKNRGCERFSLGGASPSEGGLYRFKTQFGGCEVQLEAGRFYLGNLWIKKARSLIRGLRDDPRSLPKALLSTDRFVVYTTTPETIDPPAFDDDIRCEKLEDRALLELPTEFQEQTERFRRLGFNDALDYVQSSVRLS